MARIKIGSTIVENANITSSIGLLGINYTTDMTLAALASMYDAQNSPEISFLNEDGTTSAIYTNHNLVSIAMSTIGSKNVVDVVLKVSPVELDEATVLNEKIAAQAEEIEDLKAQLSDAQARVATVETNVADTANRVTAIEETPATDTSALEARVADTEEALAAIEEGIANA